MPRTHCKDCGVEYNDSNIIWNGSVVHARCRECTLANKKRYYRERVDSEQIKRWNMKAKYGITPEQYNEMYEHQQFGCAICRLPFDKLDVDHNHKTGKVRDLLCETCNVIVGFLENHEDLVIDAVEYLKRHNRKEKVA